MITKCSIVKAVLKKTRGDICWKFYLRHGHSITFTCDTNVNYDNIVNIYWSQPCTKDSSKIHIN